MIILKSHYSFSLDAVLFDSCCMDCFLCSYSWYDSKYGQQIDAVLVDMTPFGYYRGVLLSAFRENNQVVSAIVQTFRGPSYQRKMADFGKKWCLIRSHPKCIGTTTIPRHTYFHTAIAFDDPMAFPYRFSHCIAVGRL